MITNHCLNHNPCATRVVYGLMRRLLTEIDFTNVLLLDGYGSNVCVKILLKE